LKNERTVSKIDFDFQFIKLWEAAGKEPFHLIGILELIMFVFFLIRLGVELVLMKELLPESVISRQKQPKTDQPQSSEV
jgi:hypothetical protein